MLKVVVEDSAWLRDLKFRIESEVQRVAAAAKEESRGQAVKKALLAIAEEIGVLGLLTPVDSAQGSIHVRW